MSPIVTSVLPAPAADSGTGRSNDPCRYRQGGSCRIRAAAKISSSCRGEVALVAITEQHQPLVGLPWCFPTDVADGTQSRGVAGVGHLALRYRPGRSQPIGCQVAAFALSKRPSAAGRVDGTPCSGRGPA